MRREVLPNNYDDAWRQARAGVITSTEVSALFGLSTYQTKLELWHRKKNKEIIKPEETERMRWGRRLEETIAHGIAKDNNFAVVPFKEFIKIPELKIGSSFDYKILNIDDSPSILEIKNLDSLRYRDTWKIETGEPVEAPPYIELQVQHQLLVSGFETAVIAVFVGGNQLHLVKRKKIPEIQEKIINHVKDFWRSIETNNPPPPVFPQDSKFISSLYSQTTKGKVIQSDDQKLKELSLEYFELGKRMKKLQEEKNTAKAKMLTIIQDAYKVIGDGYNISTGNVQEKEISYIRKGYRTFRVYKKLEVENE